jgi:hypothetical protein
MKKSHRAFALLVINLVIFMINAAPILAGHWNAHLINLVLAALSGWLVCRLAGAIGRREARRIRNKIRRYSTAVNHWLGI